ncbi:hypothetical protein SAMN04487881_0021 [Marinobacter sp. es.048]|uniref:HAD domain-containing protein n=1 Tax=Marinobacter sp. es.048 TaxID=1761795 RepID=UPI000B58EDD8|nr:HAD domain-containing protein [Marinobacter sp. es.048]SNC59261.1 hypothetical protein SAMN04487881_0021 [Marinobacter sp. es.048]
MSTSSLIIFLDIDGVLRVDGVQSRTELDETAVGRLRWIVRSIGARVVISSIWRHAFPLEYFQHHLGDFVIGCTPFLFPEQQGVREKEINAWVAENQPGTSWIAIDDDPDLFLPSCTGLFLCDPQRGLDLSTFNQLLAFIREKPEA